MRINRYLAQAGIASRRKAEDYVTAGRVMVNGKVTKDLSTDIQEADTVLVDGKRVSPFRKALYLFHKPRGYLCSRSDPHGDRLIYDLLPKEQGLFSVGRLDKDSEGLLFVTNDGDFAERIAHPSHETEKEYLVVVDRPLSGAERRRLLRGLTYRGEHYQADRLKEDDSGEEWGSILADWPPKGRSLGRYRVVLHEGKKREVRLLFQAVGHPVRRLIRIRIGSASLKGLRVGEYRKWSGSWTNEKRK